MLGAFEWFGRTEVAQFGLSNGVVLSRLTGVPPSSTFQQYRRALDAAIAAAGNRAVLVHVAQATSASTDRTRLVAEATDLLRRYDGRLAGGAMIVRASEFVNAILRSIAAASLLAMRLRTRSFYICNDIDEAARHLAPLSGLDVVTLRKLIEDFERAAKEPGARG
ncbi:MAG: hypothetical protein JNL21_08685 [Myxococcales bacterium]|nr:hypothetical protein [Myxococcales bacterium]